MLTRYQKAEIPKHNPEIKRACRMNNANTRRKRMVEANGGNGGNVVGPLERILQDYLTLVVGITTSIVLLYLEDQNYELRHGLINITMTKSTI